MEKETKEEIGSRTARTGYDNERVIKEKFEDWQNDRDAMNWLRYICQTINKDVSQLNEVEIQKVGARRGKADLILGLTFDDGQTVNFGISLKKQEASGYNHIDRRDSLPFCQKFEFSPTATLALRKYCGDPGFSPYDLFQSGQIDEPTYSSLKDIPRKKSHREGSGRFFFNELTQAEQTALLKELEEKSAEILDFIFRGEGDYRADFCILTKRYDEKHTSFLIETIEETIHRASVGGVTSSNRGNIYLGQLTVQRKGGTGGAWQIQFKWGNIFPE